MQFLCEGLEEDVASRKAGLTGAELLTAASGKMLLLHKLLPKLRREGHKARTHLTHHLLPCEHHINSTTSSPCSATASQA